MTAIHHTHRERGFSLPELMVALTISLLVLAGVATIFVNSQKAYTTQERLARTQENGRFAMHYLLRDIRMAGYLGCLSGLNTEKINNTLNNPTAFSYNFAIPIEGANDVTSGTSTWYPSTAQAIPAAAADGKVFAVTGTDLITLRMVDPSTQVSISESMPNSSAELKVTDTGGFNVNDIILLSDCSSADMMQITQVQTASNKLQHNPGSGSPGNSTQKLQKSYDGKAKTFKFTTRRYFIHENSAGVPSLYMDSNGGALTELVEGIEDMQILYGLDKTGDRQPNQYFRAHQVPATEWNNVVSVRVSILARTMDSKDTDVDTNTYDVNGKTVGPFNDRNQRRVFSATVLLRNLTNP